jgi:hypothetical protein
VKHIPTPNEKLLIRQAAQKEAGRRGVIIEPGYRHLIDAPLQDGGELNIALLTDDEDWNDTDLFDFARWSDFCKGFELASGGRAIVDFYVTGAGPRGELEGNVVAYWYGGKLAKIVGTMGNIYWQAAAPTKTIDEAWAEHETAERAARARRKTLDELDPA